MRVWELLDLIRRDYALNARRSFESCVVFHWRHVARVLGRVHVERLSCGHIEKFKARRLEEGASRGSVNLQLAFLRRGLRLAQRQDLARKIPHVALLAGQTVREGFLTAHQFRLVHATMEVLDRDAADVVAWLYATGWRVGEALTLTWAEITDEAVHLTASRSKNGRPRIVPIAEPLAGILARRAAVRRGPLVFHRSGKAIRSFRGVWRRACATRGLEGALIHDTRRSFARNCLLAGVSQREAMALAGWTSTRIWSRYAIVDETLLAEALGKIAALVAGKLPS